MQQLKDGDRGVQRVDFRDVVARTLALRIESTTPPGDPRFDYTAIGEVVLVGRT